MKGTNSELHHIFYRLREVQIGSTNFVISAAKVAVDGIMKTICEHAQRDIYLLSDQRLSSEEGGLPYTVKKADNIHVDEDTS